jgi:hypothetical protein
VAGEQVLQELGLKGSFFATRPKPDQLVISLRNFRAPTRVTYFIAEHRLLVEDRLFHWSSFFTGMHLRFGYGQGPWVDDLWAVLLDIVCISFVVWVASGIYIWWHIRRTRFWGALTMVAGLVSFLLIVRAM